jgi:hypothetical protein
VHGHKRPGHDIIEGYVEYWVDIEGITEGHVQNWTRCTIYIKDTVYIILQ